MIIRNLTIRISSLAVSLLSVIAVKYAYEDPDTISVTIMLTTLFFGVLRAGYSFNILSGKQGDTPISFDLTIDKGFLLLIVFLYSLHLGVSTLHTVYALFSGASIALVFLKHYINYTKGQLYPSLVISLLFPLQVLFNIALDNFSPGLLVVFPLSIMALFLLFDRYTIKSDRTDRVEIYYSLLLPVGGFSAVSVEGIDKPLYMIFSKAIDSIASVTSFVIQGNVKDIRGFKGVNHFLHLLPVLGALFFFAGFFFLYTEDSGFKLAVSTTMLINMIWLTYSIFTVLALISNKISASSSIHHHMLFFCTATTGLIAFDVFKPLYIVISLSSSFILSMLTACIWSKSE